MVRGLYTAASGMLVQSMNNDVLSNNLANVDTAGFHRQTNQVKAFPDMLIARQFKNEHQVIGRMGTGAVVIDSKISFTPGRIQNTGNALDLAIVGTGFFAINTSSSTCFTRDGRFTLDANGYLVNLEGNQVLGENGPIYIGDGTVEISSEGIVTVNGEIVDRLLLVEFPNQENLQKQGSNLYIATEEAGLPAAFQGTVIQGSLEMANVNVVKEMVNLIEVQRTYEANAKVVQAYDEILGKAVNEIAGK